jgi:hypothetical protein
MKQLNLVMMMHLMMMKFKLLTNSPPLLPACQQGHNLNLEQSENGKDPRRIQRVAPPENGKVEADLGERGAGQQVEEKQLCHMDEDEQLIPWGRGVNLALIGQLGQVVIAKIQHSRMSGLRSHFELPPFLNNFEEQYYPLFQFFQN